LKSTGLKKTAEERAYKYIAGLKETLRSLEFKEKYPQLIDAVKRYVEDAEYYLLKGDALTALASASYAEGLLDALRYLGFEDMEWRKTREKRVLVAGTFDILHPGHVYLLKKAAEKGDKLYVIVSRDENAVKIKNRSLVFNESCRKKLVESLKYVYKAVLGDKRDFLKKVVKIKPDILVLGPDQPFTPAELQSLLRKRGLKTRVYKLPARISGSCPMSSTSVINIMKEKFIT